MSLKDGLFTNQTLVYDIAGSAVCVHCIVGCNLYYWKLWYG